jgi:hypothetical protein
VGKLLRRSRHHQPISPGFWNCCAIVTKPKIKQFQCGIDNGFLGQDDLGVGDA